MNKIQETLVDLSRIPGVKGCVIVLRDGLPVAEALNERIRNDVVSGLASFLLSTTNRALASASMGEFRRFTMHSVHGKVLLIEIGGPYLVVLLDQFANIEGCEADIKATAQHLRQLSKLQI